MQRKGSGRGMKMKIDDMRVGDFLHLIDCMQEECCEHKRCSECRYNDFCDDIDLPSIDSVSIRKTIEGYAKMNGLLDHMHYVNQKWIPVSERLPETKDGYASVYVLVVDKSLLESEKPYPYELAEYYPQDFYVYNEATGKDMLIAKQGFKSANDMFSTIFHLQPVAWMYIPEYKG